MNLPSFRRNRFTGIFLGFGCGSEFTIHLRHVTTRVQNGIYPDCDKDGTRFLCCGLAHYRAREYRDMSVGVSHLRTLGHKPRASPFQNTALASGRSSPAVFIHVRSGQPHAHQQFQPFNNGLSCTLAPFGNRTPGHPRSDHGLILRAEIFQVRGRRPPRSQFRTKPSWLVETGLAENGPQAPAIHERACLPRP